MAFCTYCGAKLTEGVLFCGNCGKSTGASDKKSAEDLVSDPPVNETAETPSSKPPKNNPASSSAEPSVNAAAKATSSEPVEPQQEPPANIPAEKPSDPPANTPSPDDDSSEDEKGLSALTILLIGLGALVAVLVIVLGLMKAGIFNNNAGKVDISDCYSVEVSGVSPFAKAALKTNDEMIYELTGVPYSELEPYIQITMDKEDGLANGDAVSLHFDIDNKKLKEDYGLQLAIDEQRFKIDGLKEGGIDLASLSKEDFDDAEKAVQELAAYDIANQNELIPGGSLKDMDYEGAILLVPKGDEGENHIVAVYEIRASYPYGNEQQFDSYDLSKTTEQETTYFTGIVLSGVEQTDGTFKYASIAEELFASDATVTVDGGYNYEDSGRLYYGFIGFETKEELVDAAKSLYSDYTATDNL